MRSKIRWSVFLQGTKKKKKSFTESFADTKSMQWWSRLFFCVKCSPAFRGERKIIQKMRWIFHLVKSIFPRQCGSFAARQIRSLYISGNAKNYFSSKHKRFYTRNPIAQILISTYSLNFWSKVQTLTLSFANE